MTTISVNGQPIGEREIAAEMQFHPAGTREEAWRQAAIALAIRALLCGEAARLAVRPDSEEGGEESLIRTLLAREVHVPQADEAACRRYHAANRARFRSPDIYEAAHILFPAAPDDEAARERAKQAALAVLAELQTSPERFDALARTHSACPSAANGGRLGQLQRGDLVGEIETFVMSLDAGQICPMPVMSRYGAHVLRLDRRIAGTDPPYEAVAEAVGRHLATQSWQRAVSPYLRLLAGRACVAGIDLGGAESPLVQ